MQQSITDLRSLKIVAVRFKDHCLGDADTSALIDCAVYGLLYEETREYLKIGVWHSVGMLPDHNSEVYTLLKHPGMQVITLKPVSVHVEPGKHQPKYRLNGRQKQSRKARRMRPKP